MKKELDLSTGTDVIGKKVEVWKRGRYGMFLAKGVCLEYDRKNVQIYVGGSHRKKGLYLIDFGKISQWISRGEFSIVE